MRKRDIFSEVVIVIFFLLLTILFTYPLTENFGKAIPHLGADPLINLWILLWDDHKLLSDPMNLFYANIFFPEPLTLTYSEALLAEALLFIPFFRATGNPVAAYNFVLFSSFFLSAYGTYLLARYISGRRIAGILAGIGFGFFAFRYTHLSHLQLLFTSWLPFAFLFLHRYFAEERRRLLILSFGFATLLALSSGYYAAYGGVLLIIYFLSLLLIKRPPLLKLVKDILIAIIIFTPVLLFAFYPYYKANSTLWLKRSVRENIAFSTSFSDYLASQSNLYRNILGGFRVKESLFPGFAIYFLAFYFLLFGRKKKDIIRKEALFPLFILTSVAFVLSLGPVLRGSNIKLPYLLLYRFVPGFSGLRAPGRFGMFVIFGLSLFAGFGGSFLLEQVKGWNKRLPLMVLLPMIIILENISIPLKIDRPDMKIDPVYRFLAERPGDFAILELPLYHIPGGNLHYQLASRAHFKRLVNGCSGYLPRSYLLLYQQMADFPSNSSIEYLKENYPIRYIIVHLDRLGNEGKGKVPSREKFLSRLTQFQKDLKKEAEIGGTLILRLMNGGRGEKIRRFFPGFMLRGRKIALTTRGEGEFRLILNGVEIGRGKTAKRGGTLFFALPKRLIREGRNEIIVKGKRGEIDISSIIPY